MDFEVIYSKRKTVSIQVKNGKTIVRSPYGVTSERLHTIVNSHKIWIEKQIVKQTERSLKYPEPTKEEENILRRKARAVILPRLEYYSRIMGLKYGRISITGAKTRFGSCSSKGNISFSFRLVRYPEAAIDYVVVHELAHLVEMNHSKRFYQIIEKVLPDYKERKKLLK